MGKKINWNPKPKASIKFGIVRVWMPGRWWMYLSRGLYNEAIQEGYFRGLIVEEVSWRS